MDVEQPEVFLALIRKLMREPTRMREKGWTEADVAYVVGDAEHTVCLECADGHCLDQADGRHKYAEVSE